MDTRPRRGGPDTTPGAAQPLERERHLRAVRVRSRARTSAHSRAPSRAHVGTRRAVRVTRRHLQLPGYRLAFLESGRDSGGPVVVLLHGLASQSDTWAKLLPLLGGQAHVLAPDLLGCGASAKPPAADYSVSAHAARLRDFLRGLNAGRATLVGHSYGGGVAMSFAYQFPEYAERLGLIASGGFGAELNVALRAASVPGTVMAAHALYGLAPGWARRLLHHAAVELGLAPPTDLEALAGALDRLTDGGTRAAFLHTLRGVVSWSGQRLAATECFPLLAELPVLLIAGRQDSCIPYRHSLQAHQQLPGSRLEILPTGHFPHQERPELVAQLITELLAVPTSRLPESG